MLKNLDIGKNGSNFASLKRNRGRLSGDAKI